MRGWIISLIIAVILSVFLLVFGRLTPWGDEMYQLGLVVIQGLIVLGGPFVAGAIFVRLVIGPIEAHFAYRTGCIGHFIIALPFSLIVGGIDMYMVEFFSTFEGLWFPEVLLGLGWEGYWEEAPIAWGIYAAIVCFIAYGLATSTLDGEGRRQ